MQALAAGKHVLCEKPLCLNEKQVKKLLETAKEKKLFFMEAVWSRFFESNHSGWLLSKHPQGKMNGINSQIQDGAPTTFQVKAFSVWQLEAKFHLNLFNFSQVSIINPLFEELKAFKETFQADASE